MRSRNSVIVNLRHGFVAASMILVPTTASAKATTGWTDRQIQKQAEQLASLSIEHFDENSVLRDDELETVATIHTQKGYRFKGGFTDPARPDTFLRALISKEDGRTTYQLYAHFQYGGDWRYFDSASYVTPDGAASDQTTIIRRDVDCTYGCVYTEAVAIELPEPALRNIAGGPSNSNQPWRFRFKARSGLDWTDLMARAEIAGLLRAVDRYREQLG